MLINRVKALHDHATGVDVSTQEATLDLLNQLQRQCVTDGSVHGRGLLI
jgi:hypothetical protein